MLKFKSYLLLSDLDGTLTSTTGVISQENINAVNYFMENGGKFSYATGRYCDFLDKLAIKPNCPNITFNGALIEDKNQTIFSNPFTSDMTNIVLNIKNHFTDFFKEIRVCSELGTTYFGEQDVGNVNIYKYVFVAKEPQLAQQIASFMKEHYLSDFEVFNSWDCGVEILQRGSNKGNCALQLKKHTNSDKLVCIGDYENDISMLKVADYSFAPENAIDSVIKHADVIVSHHLNNAVKDVIEYLDKLKV